MGTQSLSDRKSTTPTIVSRNAMNPFGAKDLTARAATLSAVAASVRAGVITKAPYYQSEFREDLGCRTELPSGTTTTATRASKRRTTEPIA